MNIKALLIVIGALTTLLGICVLVALYPMIMIILFLLFAVITGYEIIKDEV